MSWPAWVQADPAQKIGAGGTRHAEVEHFRLPGLVHEDIGGLQVAVDNALIVGVLHGVAHPRQKAHAGGEVEAVAAGVLVQRQPVDKLHREIRLAVVGEAGLVDLRDAGVMQPAQDLGLVGEPLDDGGGRESATDDFEGDGAAWVILLRHVDGTHAALANDLQHLVMPQPPERVRSPGRGQEVERDVGFGPHHRRGLAYTRSATTGRDARPRRELCCRRHLQKVARRGMRLEQSLDAPAQVWIAGAGLFQERRPESLVVFLHRLEEDRSFTHRATLYNGGFRGRGLRCVVRTVAFLDGTAFQCEIGAESRQFPWGLLRRLPAAFDGLVQPGSGVGPQAIGRPWGDIHHFRRLGERQPREVAELNQPRRFGIGCGQPVEGLVQGQQVFAELGNGQLVDVEIGSLSVAPALAAALAAGVLHQDAAHRLGRGGEEVATAVPERLPPPTNLR